MSFLAAVRRDANARTAVMIAFGVIACVGFIYAVLNIILPAMQDWAYRLRFEVLANLPEDQRIAVLQQAYEIETAQRAFVASILAFAGSMFNYVTSFMLNPPLSFGWVTELSGRGAGWAISSLAASVGLPVTLIDGSTAGLNSLGTVLFYYGVIVGPLSFMVAATMIIFGLLTLAVKFDEAYQQYRYRTIAWA